MRGWPGSGTTLPAIPISLQLPLSNFCSLSSRPSLKHLMIAYIWREWTWVQIKFRRSRPKIRKDKAWSSRLCLVILDHYLCKVLIWSEIKNPWFMEWAPKAWWPLTQGRLTKINWLESWGKFWPEQKNNSQIKMKKSLTSKGKWLKLLKFLTRLLISSSNNITGAWRWSVRVENWWRKKIVIKAK